MTLARIADRMLKNTASGEAGKLRLVAFPEIAIEDQIAGAPKSSFFEVHQQKGEIVKLVAGGDPVVELHRVEQHRFAVDQRDIAQVQIAVAAAHVAGLAAFDQQVAARRQACSCVDRQLPYRPGPIDQDARRTPRRSDRDSAPGRWSRPRRPSGARAGASEGSPTPVSRSPAAAAPAGSARRSRVASSSNRRMCTAHSTTWPGPPRL